jgi:MYXO-CTERM domain-containing protein
MSTTVNVFGTVGSQAFVGFSAGTGLGTGNNDILSWSFTSQDNVPEPATAGFFALGLAALGLLRRRTFKQR